MVTRVNLLFIRMKKQGSECTLIISLLKNIFGKHFKVFQKFADIADKFIIDDMHHADFGLLIVFLRSTFS